MPNFETVAWNATDGKLQRLNESTGVWTDITTGGSFSGDAGDVPYTIPLTGGDATTVEARLKEVISVKDFGATGDGTTDDTQAFKDALAAAKDYTNIKQLCVFVPAGTYKITDTLAIDSNIMLFGAGHFASRLLGEGAGLANEAVLWSGAGAADRRYNSTIRDLYVRNTATNGIGIFLENATDYRVENVIINDCAVGIKMYGNSGRGSYYNVLRNVVCGACTTGFLIDSNVTGSECNENSFYDCRSHNGTYPFQIKSGNNNRFYSPTAETSSAPTYFFQVFSGVEDTLLVSPRCETAGSAGGVGIKLDSGSIRTVLIGGHYSNVSTALSDSGTNTSTLFNGTISGGGGGGGTPSALYWRAYKVNTNAGGFYHTEMEVASSGAVVPVSAGMITQSALGGFSATALVDGNTANAAFDTDSAGVGAYVQVQFASAKHLQSWKFYVNGGVTAKWRIEKSDNASTWTTVASALDCAGGAGWKTITW